MTPEQSAAMFESAGLNTRQKRMVAWFLCGVFGYRIVASEVKRRKFGQGAMEPTCDLLIDTNKGNKKLNFWYKEVDALLQHELADYFAKSQDTHIDSFLRDLDYVDIVTGGDHGKGYFTMIV